VTLIADDIEYEVPYGVAGRLTHFLFLRGQIERAFAYRQSHLEEALAIVTWRSPESKPDHAAAS
jgi:ligand-binding SRPBCC domain-containing protein